MRTPDAEPTHSETPAGEVVALLQQQHRRLEKLLCELVAQPATGHGGGGVREVADELAVHIAAEEQVFYPAVRVRCTEDILLESLEEHLSLKRLLADLLALTPSDPTFLAKCKVLREQVQHHHGEEEDHLFPRVRRLLSQTQREQLGQQILRQQATWRAAGRPRTLASEHTDVAESLDVLCQGPQR